MDANRRACLASRRTATQRRACSGSLPQPWRRSPRKKACSSNDGSGAALEDCGARPPSRECTGASSGRSAAAPSTDSSELPSRELAACAAIACDAVPSVAVSRETAARDGSAGDAGWEPRRASTASAMMNESASAACAQVSDRTRRLPSARSPFVMVTRPTAGAPSSRATANVRAFSPGQARRAREVRSRILAANDSRLGQSPDAR